MSVFTATSLPVRGDSFASPGWRQVLFGEDSRHRLSDALAETGGQRALIVSSPSVATGTPLVREAIAALGPRFAGLLDNCRPHSPVEDVFAVADQARALQADSLICIGGSSLVDTVKAAALILANDLADEAALLTYVAQPGAAGIGPVTRFAKPGITKIAITTTLAASEFSGVSGITHASRGAKLLYADRSFFFDTIILDPVATLQTPDEIWFSSGIKLLDNTIEEVCSRGAQPVTTTLALEAMAILPQALRASRADPLALAPRAAAQQAAWMTVFGIHNAWAGIGAALRHQLGARYNIVHGHASSILTAPILRFLSSHIGTADAAIAHALGAGPGQSSADAYHALAVELDLPVRLRDIDIPRADLPEIAGGALNQFVAHQTVRPVDLASVTGILEEAW